MKNRRQIENKIVKVAALLLLVVLTLTGSSVFAQDTNRPHEPGELLVRFSANLSDEEIRDFCSTNGISALQKLDDGLYHIAFSVTNPIAEMIQGLDAQAEVAYAEPNYLLFATDFPNDPNFGSLYGLHNTGQTGGVADADIDAPEAWTIRTDASEIVVGVIDTGIDYTHSDLAANMWTNAGEIPGNGSDDDGNGYVDDVYGYDFVNFDGDPMDDHYHGTHVAGTIGGVGNNGVGVTGVAWKVKLMALKFLSATGSGYTSDAVLAVKYATKMGAKITSNSWGGAGFSQALKDAIDAAAAKGCLFVAAAGNNGSNTDSAPQYPSCYTSANIISVAASDANDAIASFSNYGAVTVDLSAPGVGIYSTAPSNTYKTLNGTSMATPHVSGAAALIWAQSPGLDLSQVRDRLLSNVDPIAGMSGKTVTGGRLNIAKALLAGNDQVPPAAIADLKIDNADMDALNVSWTASGDNGNAGTAKAYDIRYSTSAITVSNFSAAAKVAGVSQPKQAGAVETLKISGLKDNTTYFVAIKVSDAAGNISALSNVVSAKTAAAEILFQEDFEKGSTGWLATGLWHASQLRANSPVKSWYYGRETTKNYSTGALTTGSLTSPKIDLTNATSAFLQFGGWRQVESYNGAYDRTYVEVSSNSGATWTLVWYRDSKNPSTSAWENNAGISLAQYVGKEILVRFTFNSVDGSYNTFEGWYVDDVKIMGKLAGDVIAPAAPTGMGVLAGNCAVTLTWTANAESDMAGYNVYRGGFKVNAALVTGTTYQDVNLVNGVTYAYELTAVDAAGNESAKSAKIEAMPKDVIAPAAPAGLNVVDPGNGVMLNLGWNANGESDLAGYNVYRNSVKVNAALLTVTTYTDTGLTSGTNYSYTIKAQDTSGNESASSAAANGAPGAPAIPVLVSASEGNASTVLSWTANTESDLAGYNVYQKITTTTAGGNSKFGGTSVTTVSYQKINSALVSAASLKITGLTNGQTYAYVVEAVDNAGFVSGKSNVMNVTPKVAAVSPASALKVSDPGTGTTLNLSWTASGTAGITGYNIYRDGGKIAGPVSAVAFQDAGLTAGMKYGYSITAVGAEGNESDATLTVNGTPGAPAIPALSGASGDALANLSWTANTEADLAGYNIYRDGVKINTAILTGTTFQDSGLKNGTGYAYEMTSVDTFNNESNKSAKITVIPKDNVAPVAPAGLNVIDSGTGTTLDLSWTANAESDLTGYNVYRNGVKLNAALLTAVSFVDSGLTKGSNNSYVIKAQDSSGNESAASIAVSGTPGAPAIPALTVTAGDASADLSWAANTEADLAGYNIYRDGVKINSAILTGTTFKDSALKNGVEYGFEMTAVDAFNNESGKSAKVTVTPKDNFAPVAPAGVKVVDPGTGTTLNLSWTANTESDVTGYIVYRNGVKLNAALLTAASFVDSGLTKGVSVSYVIKALDNSGNESMASAAVSAIPGAPGVPSGLMVNAGSKNVTLNWTANTEADLAGYNLYRDGAKINGALLSVTTFKDSNLVNGTVYVYEMTAVDTFGNESAKSVKIEGKPQAGLAPVAPAGLAAADPGTGTALNLTWTANTESDLAGYNIYRNGVKVNAALVTVVSFTDSGLTQGTAVSYVVKAVNTDGVESNASNTVSGTPGAPVIPALTVTADDSSANLSWTANTEADLAGYNVYRDGVKINGALLTVTTLKDSGLKNGTDYGFEITAVDTFNNESGKSAKVTVTPKDNVAPVAPAGVKVVDSGTTLELSWTANTESDLTGYNVYRNGVKLNAALLTSASFVDSGLTQGVSVSYVIKAQDTSNNESAASVTVTAIPGAPVTPALTVMADDSSANLSWTANTEADLAGYNIYRDGMKINASILTGTTFKDGGLKNGVEYGYEMTAVDTFNNESSKSVKVTVTPKDNVAPVAPAGVKVVDPGTGTTLNLSWTANTESDLTGYNVYRNGVKLNASLLTSVFFADSGLTPGMSVSYVIKAQDTSSNESAASVTAAGTPGAPAIPALSGTASDASVELSWTANTESDLAGYNIYRDGAKINSAILTGTTFKDGGLNNGASYEYQITSVDTFGNESGKSGKTIQTPKDSVQPGIPTGLNVKDPGDGATLNLTWSANTESDVTGYNIYRNGTKVNTSLITATNFTDSGLAMGGTYVYTVRAQDSSGNESGVSGSAAATSGAPLTPALLSVTAGNGKATLQWTSNTDADIAGYDVYEKVVVFTPTGGGSKFSGGTVAVYSYQMRNASLITGTVFTVTGLENGKTYNFVVIAKDLSGNKSNYSNEMGTVPFATASVSDAEGMDAEKNAAEPMTYFRQSIAAGDINADGFTDMLVTDANGAARLIVSCEKTSKNLNGLTDATDNWIGEKLGRVTAAKFVDFDMDGYLDLVVFQDATEDSSKSGLILLRNGQDGRFVDETAVRLNGEWQYLVALSTADMDQDGASDLVASFEGRIEIWRNDAAGKFTLNATVKHADTQAAVREMVLTDVNNDGKLDVVCAGSEAFVLVNSGFGTFDRDDDRFDHAAASVRLLAGDLDGDLREDFLFVREDGMLCAQINSGNGYFVDETQNRGLDTIEGVRSAAMGDVNGDNTLDLVIGRDGDTMLLTNDQNESFTANEEMLQETLKLTTNEIVLVDVNGDGSLDMLRANGKAGEIQYNTVSFNIGKPSYTITEPVSLDTL